MIESVMDLISQYGYISIFSLLSLGMIGIPLPEETLLTAIGFIVSLGKIEYLLSILSAFLGSVIGMSFNYFIGKYLGLPFLEKYGRKVFITPDKLKLVKKWYAKYGRFTVFIGYFIPGIRQLTAYFSGLSKWKYSIFALYAFTGGFIWTTIFISLGYLVGENWYTVLSLFHRYLMFVIIILAILIGGAFVSRHYILKRKQKQEGRV